MKKNLVEKKVLYIRFIPKVSRTVTETESGISEEL